MEIVLSLVIIFIAGYYLLKDPSYELACMVAVRILVPESARFFGTSISINTVMILFAAFSIILHHSLRLYGNDKKFMIFILLFMAFITISLPLSDYGSLEGQFGLLIKSFISDFCPALITILGIKRHEQADRIARVFVISTIIACSYGILTYVIGYNPYGMMLEAGEAGMSAYTLRGRVTSSTFVSTNAFGYFLVIALPFLTYLKDRPEVGKNEKTIKLAFFLVLVSIVLCKKRAAMIAGIAFLIMYALSMNYKKALRVIVSTISICVLFAILLNTIPSLFGFRDYLKSVLFFWNDSAIKGIERSQLGSSMALRLRQVTYPFIEVKDNYLFGHGYSWCGWYLSQNKLHPVLFGFETIIALSICELGVLGPVVYGVLFAIAYKYMHVNEKNKINYPLLYTCTYAIDTVATGLNYLFLFLVITVIIGKKKAS